MTSASKAGFVVEAWSYEWTSSRSPLARKLTNYQPFPDSSITSRPLTHGTAFSRGCRQVVSSRLDPKQKQVRLKTWIQILRKRRAQKTFHWKHREASFHLFSAELFLDH